MSLGEEETRTPHTHTPSHSRRRAAPALKGKPRCPARDPASPEPRNTEFPGRMGPGAAEARRPPKGPPRPSCHSLKGKTAAGWLRCGRLVSPAHSSQGCWGVREGRKGHGRTYLCGSARSGRRSVPSAAGGPSRRCADGEERQRGDREPLGTSGWSSPEGSRRSPERLGNPHAEGSLPASGQSRLVSRARP